MRLLYVHDRFGALAGAEANARLTASELGRRGHSVGLLHGPPTGRDEAGWVEAFPERFPLEGRSSPEATRTALGAFRPDVVYVHKMSDLGVLSELLAHRAPVVRMIHDHDLYCLRSYRYNYVTRRICRRAASWRCVFPCLACIARHRGPGLPVRWASYGDKRREIAINRRFHRLLAVTPFMRDELVLNGFDPGRIGIHPPVPRPAGAFPGSSFSERNLLVFAGQIIRGKGVDILLRALARVRASFECVILGEGSHRPVCEKLSRRLGLSSRVRFPGFVSPAELSGHYLECSAVVIPSVWPEPIATVGLEAMRLGLPVVAFDAGGIRDWLTDGENGFLVPWMDIDAFAAALDRLLGDKALARRLGANGLARVTERYDFDRYIESLEDVFADAAGLASSGASHRPCLA